MKDAMNNRSVDGGKKRPAAAPVEHAADHGAKKRPAAAPVEHADDKVLHRTKTGFSQAVPLIANTLVFVFAHD
jgi:hypothetical protein